ncbi:hypothetical protein ATANTOWER_004920 [Ataeniobius toweri]|uniref:Uncharacterized protein n=1 Tax=Ataeniobius toweri TaxID=208326 RepID=A0ABU7BJ63_9TELE|nr:hypothetical protein [Ataeniobius toweri]
MASPARRSGAAAARSAVNGLSTAAEGGIRSSGYGRHTQTPKQEIRAEDPVWKEKSDQAPTAGCWLRNLQNLSGPARNHWLAGVRLVLCNGSFDLAQDPIHLHLPVA